MNKGFVAILSASALLASTAGFAGHSSSASESVNNSSGLFISGNIGYGHNELKTINPLPEGIRVHRNSFAWTATIGYQFNPYVAVEAGYMALPRAKVTVDVPKHPVDNSTLKLKTDAIIADVKGIYPIDEQFDIFGKVGLAFQTLKGGVTYEGVTENVDTHKHHTTPLFGLGVDYNITQNWAVGLQGVTTLKSGNDFPATYTALVGVTYKFS